MVLADIQRARQRVKRHDEYAGVLGTGSGNPYAGMGKYWVRFPAGTDGGGLTVYTPPRQVRYAGESPLIGREGAEVLVRIDPFDGVETITRIVPDFPERTGIDSRLFNHADAINKWWDVRNFIRLLSRPVGSGASESTKITVREDPFHVNAFQDPSTFAGTLPAAQPDLASLIPTAGNHRLAIAFFDRIANAPAVYASTVQALSSPFDITDYEECFAQLPHNEHTALLSIELADGATSVSNKDVIEDLRTWLPTPPIMGVPNPMPAGKAWLLRSTHQQLMFDLTVQGEFTVQGELTVL